MQTVKNCAPGMRSAAHHFEPAFGRIWKDIMQHDVPERPAFPFKPPVNIIENDDNYTIEVIAPGYEKKDFNIQTEENKLILEVTEIQKEGEEPKYIRKEFGKKPFKRVFTLSHKTDKKAISAKYEGGILFVSIGKNPEYKKNIEIQ